MNNLALLRKNKNLTQKDMAEILKVSKPTYNHYENGRYEPDIKTLIKLADFFGCSVDYLLAHKSDSLLYADSFTKEQQKAISLIKKLDEKEISLLIGYLAHMTNTPIDEIF